MAVVKIVRSFHLGLSQIEQFNLEITIVTTFDSNLFDLYFLLSKKHRKKKVRQKSSSKSDDESEGKVLPIDKNNAHSEFLV